MTRRRPTRPTAAFLVGLAVLGWLAARGAAQPPPPPVAAVEPPAEAQTEGIDEILRGEEEVLAGEGYTYDPGNRRDPFKSLLTPSERTQFKGPRPEGIPGLLIDELTLTGIFHTQRGYVAQVKAANQAKSYLLKEGDELYDGDVKSINDNEIIFEQIVQDPTALKPFREVTRKLNPA